MSRGSSSRGVMLVEVLVAIMVLSVNLVGWTAALQVMLSLVRGIAVLTVPVDIDEALKACALAALLPLRRFAVTVNVRHRLELSQYGLTLVEVLVAITIGGVVLGLVAALTSTTWRISRDAQHHAEMHETRVALPALLAEIAQAAGRGLDEGTCGIDVADAGGRLVVRYKGTDGAIVVDEIFAGRDAAGRQALYLRRLPHARQPWIEDVASFHVVVVVRDEHDRAMRVELEMVRTMATSAPHAFVIDLPHRPCVGSAP